MTAVRSVHPFPAKMAPELVSQYIDGLRPGTNVLDPMMGSGTFAISAAVAGHMSVGIDSDPLALTIAAAASWLGDEAELREWATSIAGQRVAAAKAVLADSETSDFVDYWFDKDAQASLASLAKGIGEAPEHLRAPLWCAFSRLIITKDAGASRARDVSHSRPHVVREVASFDPKDRFLSSVETVLARRFSMTADQRKNLKLTSGDARSIPLPTGSVDAVMTSPPYLTAIDYLRGHRLSLVWMGHSLSSLRSLRGENIGSERGAPLEESLVALREDVVKGSLAPNRTRILNRYLVDLNKMIQELSRVIRPGGTATFVVANSNHRGTEVKVDDALAQLGERHEMREVLRSFRLLPDNRRYLPTPASNESQLGKRMRSETVLTLSRA